MKLLLLASLVAVAIAQPFQVSEKDLGEWESFKVKYLKEYETAEEEERRMQIFAGHLRFISEHNAKYERGEETFTVGINKFADQSHEEFRSRMNEFKIPAARKGEKFDLVDKGLTKTSVDWRKEGAVTPVKEEGSCGPCWAFSATGSLEGQWFLKNGTLVSLSEQNLIDCSRAFNNNGCEGGYMDNSFEYIKANGGIDSEAAYPYLDQNDVCNFDAEGRAASVTGFVDITEGSESDLQTAVANIGPISFLMDGRAQGFQLYKSGIYGPSSCDSTSLNHAALVVGYGSSFFQKYWLAKNSWGTDWGLSGYFMLAKDKYNMCGVASAASYPLTTGQL